MPFMISTSDNSVDCRYRWCLSDQNLWQMIKHGLEEPGDDSRWEAHGNGAQKGKRALLRNQRVDGVRQVPIQLR